MSTSPYPDPMCRGPHKAGERFAKWQHTTACKAALSARASRHAEVLPEVNDADESDIVDRARVAGAI